MLSHPIASQQHMLANLPYWVHRGLWSLALPPMDSSKSCVVTLALYIRRHFSCDLKIHISCFLCLSDPYLPSVSLTASVSLLSQWLTALYNEQSCLSLANEASSDECYLQVRVDSVNCLGISCHVLILKSLIFFLYIFYLGDCAMVPACRSENSSRVRILSLHHVGSRDQMQNLKLVSEHLYSLSCLDGPTNPTFKSRMLNNAVVALLTCCYFECVWCSLFLDQKCVQRCNHKPASLNSLALDRSAGFHYS